MSPTLKESLFGMGTAIASKVGLPRMLYSRLNQNCVSILMYHGVLEKAPLVPDWSFITRGEFERQISYVSRSFRVLTLTEAVSTLRGGRIEEPSVVITFDDGYQNNFEVAFKVLKKYRCPATIFLSTKYIDADRIPWFGRLNWAVARTAEPQLCWQGARYSLSNSREKAHSILALHKVLKQQHPYSIDGQVDEICEQLKVGIEQTYSLASPYHMLRSSAIHEMAASGLIDFGAHTHSHSILSRLLPSEAQQEVLTSLRAVEAMTGKPCSLFAYPNGGTADYNHDTIDCLRAAGVLAAVSTQAGPNTSNTPTMELRRYGVSCETKFHDFQAMVHHIAYRIGQLAFRNAHA